MKGRSLICLIFQINMGQIWQLVRKLDENGKRGSGERSKGNCCPRSMWELKRYMKVGTGGVKHKQVNRR